MKTKAEGVRGIIEGLEPLETTVGGNVIRPVEFGPVITLPDGRTFYEFRRIKFYGHIYFLQFNSEIIEREQYNSNGDIVGVTKKYAKGYHYNARPTYRFESGSSSVKVHVLTISAPLLRLVFLQTDGLQLFLSGKTEANHMAAVCQPKEDYDKIYRLYYRYRDAEKTGIDPELIDKCKHSDELIYRQLRAQTYDLFIPPVRTRINTLDNVELCTPRENKQHARFLALMEDFYPDVRKLKISVSYIRPAIERCLMHDMIQNLTPIKTPFYF